MNFATVNNITLHYTLKGEADKPVMVFLNSLGSDFRIWHKVVPAFADDYQILHYDKRGHGLSDAPPAPYSIRDHSEDLKALLAHLNIEKVILIGVSVGGMIALDFAARYPSTVQAMVLSDTGMKLGTAEFWNERVAKIRSKSLAAFAEPILERWFTKRISAEDLRGYHSMLARTPEDGYTGTCEAIRDADLREVAKTVSTPALVMTGDEDESTPPPLGQALADTLPNASFKLIIGAGHFPCIEQPEQTIEHISNFLEGLPEETLANDSKAIIHANGMTKRRSILGNAHVDRAETKKTDLDMDFQDFITRYAWGEVWQSDTLNTKERHFIVLAMMAALGKEHEFAMHVRATKQTGVTQEELADILKTVAIYAGLPSANTAFGLAKKVYKEASSEASNESEV